MIIKVDKIDRDLKEKILGGKVIIRIYDYSDFDGGLCFNGGKYGYWETYIPKEGGYEVSYHTTADFEYCDRYGSFCRCSTCSYYDLEKGVCKAPYEMIPPDVVLEKVKKVVEKGREDEWVEIELVRG